MDGLHIFLVVLFGAVCFSQDLIHNPVSEVTVIPGDNITLYCDCKKSTGVYILWIRNCSHENQPTLVLGLVKNSQLVRRDHFARPLPRFEFLSNESSNTYDLLIMNITDSDEGLYYCGTEQSKVEDDKYISQKNIYSYGNATTRITVTHDKDSEHHQCEQCERQDCALCLTLLYTMCPALTAISSLLSSLVVYHLCQRKAGEPQVDQIRQDTRTQTRLHQEEDVCYAALEIRQASQRPKRKNTQTSDFSTYSAINTSTG